MLVYNTMLGHEVIFGMLASNNCINISILCTSGYFLYVDHCGK